MHIGVIARVAICLVGGVTWLTYHPDRAPAFLADQLGAITGANPHPITLLRPADAPLSAMAQLGKTLFYDTSLSASGRQSCASCHSVSHAFGPENPLAVQLGGLHADQQGVRAPPSLDYLYRQPGFSIGPDTGAADAPQDLTTVANRTVGMPLAQKIAAAPAAVAMVPQGGLFWDGRVDTLQDQASGPLFNPVEMDNASATDFVARLSARDTKEAADEAANEMPNEKANAGAYRQASSPSYHDRFTQLFGGGIFRNSDQVVSEALFAISRYEVEGSAFHRYSSKYDAWLEGKARLSAAEERGMQLFNDPAKANCAGCHLSAPSTDGLPPMFTDYQYEALGVPRNNEIGLNKDPRYFDLGICGPYRQDMAKLTQYCGMFLTPTLRNVATRHTFFHNGKYHTLKDALAFYNERDTNPGKFYPRGPDGKINKYDDLPAPFRANIDVIDPPFDRHLGDQPAMTDQDIQDIIAFLGTLNDGYKGTL